MSSANIIILTPIDIEYEAVKMLFNKPRLSNHPISGYTYLCSKVKAKNARYDVVLRKTGSGNLTLMNAVHQVVKDFNPKVILLTGTAGGLKKVKIGDLVIGSKAYNYEAGREKQDSFSSRPSGLLASKDLIELAEKVAQEGNWKVDLPNFEEINYYTRPIASGEKVIETIDNYLFKRIRKHYDDAVAVEMEASGFLEATAAYPAIKVLNIRSISDLLGDKKTSNKNRSREKAAQIAAAFTMELINNLTVKKYRPAPVIFQSALFVGLASVLFFFIARQFNERPDLPNDQVVNSIQSDLNPDNTTEQLSTKEDQETVIGTSPKAVKRSTTSPTVDDQEDTAEPTTPEKIIDTALAEPPSPPVTLIERLPLIRDIKCFVHVFDEKEILVFGVQFELNGEYLGDDIKYLELAKGKIDTLKLRYGGMEYVRMIKGSELNNQEVIVKLEDFTSNTHKN